MRCNELMAFQLDFPIFIFSDVLAADGPCSRDAKSGRYICAIFFSAGANFWVIFGPFRQFWVIFGPIWAIFGHFWAILGNFRSFLGHFLVLIFCGKICICAI